jgi:nitroreductase
MDVFEAVQERRSIRAYQDKPVPREKPEKILEAVDLHRQLGALNHGISLLLLTA